MTNFIFGRCVGGFCLAAATLAGCGGSQALIGATGAMQQTMSAGGAPQRSLVNHAYRVLHSFGGSGDGMNPSAALIDIEGTLYSRQELSSARAQHRGPPSEGEDNDVAKELMPAFFSTRFNTLGDVAEWGAGCSCHASESFCMGRLLTSPREIV